MIFSAVFFGSRLEQLAMLAARHRVPARATNFANYSRGLMSYGINRTAPKAGRALGLQPLQIRTRAHAAIRTLSRHRRMAGSDPNGLREHSRDLPIAALVTDRAMEAWYHPSIA